MNVKKCDHCGNYSDQIAPFTSVQAGMVIVDYCPACAPKLLPPALVALAPGPATPSAS